MKGQLLFVEHRDKVADRPCGTNSHVSSDADQVASTGELGT